MEETASVPRGKPLWKQGLVVFLCLGMGELLKKVAQIMVRLKAASFCRLDQTVERSRILGSIGLS